jgi:hypothetical protein
MSFQPIATAYISWLSLEEGGREKPPSGAIYAATAKFSEQSDEFFSVVLRRFVVLSNRTKLSNIMILQRPKVRGINKKNVDFGKKVINNRVHHSHRASSSQYGTGRLWKTVGHNPLLYDLDFFAPELVVDKLSPGTKLWITEGPRTVAQGEIVSVDAELVNKIRSECKSWV